jgi:hypothetical protein
MMTDDSIPCSHSHYWIDPDEPTIHRYSPMIRPGRREMKAGKTYRCLNCGRTQTRDTWQIHVIPTIKVLVVYFLVIYGIVGNAGC